MHYWFIDFDSRHGLKSWETSLRLAIELYWYSNLPWKYEGACLGEELYIDIN